MSLSSGTKLGPYEIQSPLGAGGMGEVYRARDTRLDRIVAIKIMPANFSADAERLHRFEQEARAAAALNHPNILAIYDIGTENGSPYIVSELLEGETLREAMRDRILPLRKAIDYGCQIARGLSAAHEKGIVHRDLKPENVFVSKDGHVKILDFGLAKLVAPAGAPELTNIPTIDHQTTPGVVLGTVGYMSPEQVRGLPSDQRSDIFSLGAILYESLSGKRAFQGRTSADTMSAILKEDPPELSETNRAVPPAIDRIVHHCLEKNPEERFQSARDVAFGLEALSSATSITAAQPVVAGRAAPARMPWLVAIAALIVAGAAAFWIARITVPVSSPVFTRLSFRGGYIGSARFASDGQTIVYSAGFGGDPMEIYTTRPGATQSRELGFKNSSILGISHGDEMAITLNHNYFMANASFGTLARVPFTGGSPREVAEQVLCADWSPDGESLALGRIIENHIRIEYPQGKILYDVPGWASDLRISPDGNTVAYVEHPELWDSFGHIAIVDRAGKKTILSGDYSSVLGLAWDPSGKEIWYTASKVHISSNLYAVSLSGKQRLVWAGAGSMTLKDISRDGHVLFVRENRRRGIAGLFPGQAKETDLSWQDWSLPTDLSADGKWLYFSEEGDSAGAKYSAYMRATDGSPAIRLGDGSPWAASPDGKWVASIIPGTPQQLMLLPTRAGDAVNLTQPGFGYDNPEWLPDGKRLLVLGFETGKPPREYILNVDGGQMKPVAPERQFGVLSPDGKSLVVAHGDKLIFYPVDGGEPREQQSLMSELILLQSAHLRGRYAYASLRQEVPLKVYRWDLQTGQKELWKELAPDERAGVYSIGILTVTPDGKWYSYSYVRDLSDLYMVEGLK